MTPDSIPETTIARLPIYLRALAAARSDGVDVIRSSAIAAAAGTNAAQVRKDLSHLGELGTRGVGYDVETLHGHIVEVLGLSAGHKVAVVGAGRLGTALINYVGMVEREFAVVAVFDSDPEKIGTEVGGVTIQDVADLESALCEGCADIVVITTPADVAQRIADKAVAGRVPAILDFAPTTLHVPDDVILRKVDLSVELHVLSYHLARKAQTR